MSRSRKTARHLFKRLTIKALAAPQLGILLYIQEQSLEVLPFRMVDVNGVVARLIEAVKDSYLAAALGCCREYCECECLLVHHLRAAVCEHESSRGYLCYGCRIESLVCSQGVLEGTTMLCECRRIHDHEVVFSFRSCLQIIDCIAAETSVAGLVKTVDGYVSIHHHHGFLRTVHRVDMLSSRC